MPPLVRADDQWSARTGPSLFLSRYSFNQTTNDYLPGQPLLARARCPVLDPSAQTPDTEGTMTEPAKITDSHCHLDFPQFEGEHADLLARAAARGVHRMVTICTSLDQEPKVRALADAHDPVFYAAGTHPMSVGKVPEIALEQLTTLAAHPKCVGIGETGLDYHYTVEMRPNSRTILAHSHRSRPPNRPAPHRPRPCRRRRYGRDPERRARKRRLHLRHALLFLFSRPRPSRPRSRVLPFHVRHHSLPEKPGPHATSSPPRPSIAFWSKPMLLTLRHHLTGASATNRATLPTQPA